MVGVRGAGAWVVGVRTAGAWVVGVRGAGAWVVGVRTAGAWVVGVRTAGASVDGVDGRATGASAMLSSRVEDVVPLADEVELDDEDEVEDEEVWPVVVESRSVPKADESSESSRPAAVELPSASLLSSASDSEVGLGRSPGSEGAPEEVVVVSSSARASAAGGALSLSLSPVVLSPDSGASGESC